MACGRSLGLPSVILMDFARSPIVLVGALGLTIIILSAQLIGSAHVEGPSSGRRQLPATGGTSKKLSAVGPVGPKSSSNDVEEVKDLIPPYEEGAQRCDYTWDDETHADYYDHRCWKLSTDDWQSEGSNASNILHEHGALYLKNVLTKEETKAIHEYLVNETSNLTLNGMDYWQNKVARAR